MSKLGKDRFNVKDYSRTENIARSTVYGILRRLASKKLVIENFANFTISERGFKVVEALGGGVGSSRKECREKGFLSMHMLKYKAPICDRSNFSEDLIKDLKPLNWQVNDLPNLRQVFVYFEGATIVINPKQIVVRIHDVVGDDSEQASYESFSKAVSYFELCMGIGLITEGVYLEEGEYARVESVLADALHKIDDRYFLLLKDGKTKFWIDHSPPSKIEDETNRRHLRDRVDEFIDDLPESDAVLSDIDKIAEILGFVSKIEVVRYKRELSKAKEYLQPGDTPDYFR